MSNIKEEMFIVYGIPNGCPSTLQVSFAPYHLEKFIYSMLVRKTKHLVIEEAHEHRATVFYYDVPVFKLIKVRNNRKVEE